MSGAVDWLLLALIGGALLTPVATRVLRRRFDVLEPIVFFAIAYGFMFVVRPAAMLIEDDLVFVSTRQALDVSNTFTEMLVLALVGAVSFVIGYELSLGRRLALLHRPRREEASAGPIASVAALVGLSGLAAYLTILASSGLRDALAAIFEAGNTQLPDVGSLSMYGSFLFLLLVPASLVTLALGIERRRVHLVVLALLLAGVFAVIAVPSGRRIALLPLLGGVFVLWYLRRGTRPSYATLGVIVLVAVIGATFLSDLRGRVTRDEGVVATIGRSTSPSRILDAVTKGPDTEMAPALAAALAVVPESLPHGYGSAIVGDLVRRPIPRSLWGDKPPIPRHELLATVWPVEYERGAINAEFSVLLYFYWDFGIPGVILGLAAFGVLARYLYEYLQWSGDRVYAHALYALALWFVVIGLRDSPVDTFVRACFVLVPVWVIFVLARVAGARTRDEMIARGRAV